MPSAGLTTGRTLLLGLVTFLLLLPETLPVPVLRALVLERFQVSDALTTLFLSANQLGALLAAPLIGLWVARSGRRRELALVALLLDAVLMQALAHPLDYTTFLLLRTAEGAAHITALTLLMGLVADAAGERRGRALGCVGAGLTLGVALGAALGGRIGRDDPLLTLHVASVVLLLAAAMAAWLLPTNTPVRRQHGWRDVLGAVRHEPRLRAPLLLAFADRFTVGFFTAGFPLLLRGVHGVATPQIGMLLAAFLLPFALLSYPAGRLAERWSRRALVGCGSLLYGLGVALVAVVPPGWLWGLMPWLGVTSAVMFVPTLLWLLERGPALDRTTVMASFHAAGALGFLLGPLCCGGLIALGGPGLRGYVLAFAIAGAAEVLGALVVWRAAPAQAFGPKPPPG
ncbi:MAG: MFS transporter [Planctomycetes bacterium]|nr:MFS transporter [Planctomycetota bacterium]